jgi:4-hydroxyacetophenone monooxygenase
MNHITRMGSDLHTLAADESLLDLALEGADVAPLLMVLVHLSGEEHWLDEVAPHINGPWNFQESVPEELKQRLRARTKAVLLDFAARGTPLPAEPPPGLLRKMLSSGVGGPVPD